MFSHFRDKMHPHLYFPVTVTFLLLIWTGSCDNFSPTQKIREIIGLTGNLGQLPCPIGSIDEVSMILWFKDSSGSPIYSYDARLDKEPRHLTVQNDWGVRLYFRVWPNLRRYPSLIIKDIQPSDEGTYRCRVDYKNAPTVNYIMQFVVIRPPSRLEIFDASESHLASDIQVKASSPHADITYLGPYHEGQNVTLKCVAYGGNPLPSVKWVRRGKIVDSNYEFVNNNYTMNELRVTNLGSEHSSDLYTCQASNYNESKAISQSVNLDVYLGVKEIDLEVPEEMTAGVEYTFICKATGAYPAVKVEIYKGQKRLGPKYQTKSDVDNMTVYSFLYKPEILDDEKTISCKAENPWLKEKPLVARRTLKIKYTPVAILRFGQNKTTDFSVGESVIMQCHVKANPPIYSISWFHGHTKMENDENSGIRLAGMTLHITNLRTGSGGKYFCQAANVIGKEMSNPLVISLNIPPRCVSSEVVQIPLELGESHKLECNIHAWPPDLNFYWTLNRSNDIVPILPMARSSNQTKGAIQGLPLEDFDDYIFPITRPEGNPEVKITSPEPENFTRLSERGTGKGLSLTDTEGSEGGSGGSPRKSVTHSQSGSGSSYLRMRTRTVVEEGGMMSGIQEERELKSLDKKDGLKEGSDGLIHPRAGAGQILYGRWKAPEDSPDNIHHQAVLSYTINRIEDYGLVSCWAKNSVGKQLSPCIFHVVPREGANQDEALGDKGNGNLTGKRVQKVGEDGRGPIEGRRETGILVPSKLPMTSGIILMALLIFMASFGLSLLLLVMLAKRRRRQILGTRKISPNTFSAPNRHEPSGKERPYNTSPSPSSLGQVLGSSAIEKCASPIFLGVGGGNGALGDVENPFSSENIGLGAFYQKDGESSELASCFDLNSEVTTFTVISNQNDFPPPPTSITSTTSPSHGYGSIEDDDDEDEVL